MAPCEGPLRRSVVHGRRQKRARTDKRAEPALRAAATAPKTGSDRRETSRGTLLGGAALAQRGEPLLGVSALGL
jgi:hypothetical protein